jgi:hypothetical protein
MHSEGTTSKLTSASVPRDDARRPLLKRLGWGHRGFRVDSRRKATLGLVLLLALPFAIDQIAAQDRIANHRPDLRGYLALADASLRTPDAPIYPPGNDPRIPWRAMDVQPGWYLYPPFFLALVWPLSQLPAVIAVLLFESLKWVALFFALRFAWRLCTVDEEDVPPAVALGGILLAWRFLWNEFAHQNVNMFLLLAVLAGCRLLRRRRDAAAGFVVGLAACVKVTPALVLVYFVYKRRWRSLAGAAAAAVVCLVLLPAACYGWSANLEHLSAWYRAVVGAFLAHGHVDSMYGNLSITALVNRLFARTDNFDYGVTVTLVELPAALRNLLRTGVSLAILVALFWACRRRIDPAGRPLAFAAEIGLVQIVMLLLSGISWKAHYVAMLLPYTVLLAWLADARSAGPRRMVGGLLIASMLLCTLTGDVLTPIGANYAEALGAITLGAVAAGAGLVLVHASLRQPARVEVVG